MKALVSPLAGLKPEFASKGHVVWKEITPYFTPADFANPFEMDVHFLRWLRDVRVRAGVPMWLTSDARPEDGTVGADLSAHKKRPCRAIDGQVRDKPDLVGSEQLARIYIAAVMLGCVRFGTYKSEKGLGDIYHLDCETHEENPSPRWWTKWGKAAALVLAFVA